MHEVFLPIMIMVFTLFVMFGLIVIFRGWVVERERLMSGHDADGAKPAGRT